MLNSIAPIPRVLMFLLGATLTLFVILPKSSGQPASSPQSFAEGNYSERWDVLPLAGNNLRAAPPLLGEKDTLPTFTRELIQVQWRAKDPIDLYIIRPTNVAKPPAVIFLYSFPNDTDRFRDDAYCASVVKHGFAAIGFVSALSGHRYHDRPMKEWFINQLPESIGASVHDVQMIFNYLGTRQEFDMDRIGIYGQGSGGTIAILSAATDSRIKAVDVLDPWGDWPDWMADSPQIPDQDRASYSSHEFLIATAPFDPIDYLPHLTSRPLRLQQTLFSQVTPSKARNKIWMSAPPSSVKVRYIDIGEYKKQASGDGKILDWLQEQLRATPNKQ